MAMATSGNYEVFLNHRGPDTKITIASSLYWWLTSHGLSVFFDREEVEGGLVVGTQIKEAIASASVHVAVFSPRYAESASCLKELHLMTVSGKPIIPIFYNVKPADVRKARKHRGAYAADLDKHERKSFSTVLNWRNDLYNAARFGGFELDRFNGDLGRLLFEVFTCVLKRLEKPRILLMPRPSRGIKEFNAGIEEFNGGIGFTDLSHDMKVIVLKLDLDCVKCQKRALITIYDIEGVESVAVDVKEMKLIVIGSLDPFRLTDRLRTLLRGPVKRGPCSGN